MKVLNQADAERLASLDFATPNAAPELEQWLVAALREGQVDTAAPNYFGFPHGSVGPAASEGARLSAELNPELATRHHAPFASALEDRLLTLFGSFFYGNVAHRGIVTTGGSEANLSALLLALAAASERFTRKGVAALGGPGRVYVSSDAHPSVRKACRMTGLGDEAFRVVGSDSVGRMQPERLRAALAEDRAKGLRAVAIVATLGTTTTGAVDPIAALVEVARGAKVWLHVDAAFGGWLALDGQPHAELEGLGEVDSVCFDPPKVCDVPLGSGLLFTRHPQLFRTVFSVGARYLPRTADEPFATTPSWSRGARLLPLAFSLSRRGFSGLASSLRAREALAVRLRERLADAGFTVFPGSALPVVAFSDESVPREQRAKRLVGLAEQARVELSAYLPMVRLPSGEPVLRAAIVSEHTQASDVERLCDVLAAALRQVRIG